MSQDLIHIAAVIRSGLPDAVTVFRAFTWLRKQMQARILKTTLYITLPNPCLLTFHDTIFILQSEQRL
jgi:hypothetical protein